MPFSRSVQQYTAASGFPWTVATLASLPLGFPVRYVYAWVGLPHSMSYALRSSVSVLLKKGGVTVETLEMVQLTKDNTGGVDYCDSFCGHSTNNGLPQTYAGENAIDFRFCALAGSSSLNASMVFIRPVKIICGCDAVDLQVTGMNWESGGALGAGVPLVCYLGVLSTLRDA